MTRVLSTVLAAAVALVLVLALGSGEPLREVLPATPDSLRQSYLDDALSWRFDDDGTRTQLLAISTGERLVGKPVTHLGALRFAGRDNDGRDWRIDAGAGILQEQVDELQLLEGVVIRESGGLGTLETPRLRLFLGEERAQTRAPVTLTTARSKTTAVGLDLDLKAGTARLLSRVNTIYEG